MKTTKSFFVFLILLVMPEYLAAQDAINETLMYPKLKLDLPLFDIPYQIEAMNTVGHGFFSSYANPSMSQSLALTSDIYSAFHFGMKYFYDNSNIGQKWKYYMYYIGIILGDFVLAFAPGGNGWLHEEYHRAVMSRYGVNSFNGMNRFPIGAHLIHVNEIKDEDLIHFKKESPHDFVRLHVAGIEGEAVLINDLQRNNFYYDQELSNEVLYWMLIANSHLYIYGSSDRKQVDADAGKANQKEKSVSSRDFTGYDMTGWVYDLFRPDEPYEARGAHPSGTGINRYRTTKDLTDEEFKYLRMQTYLYFINYLSPMLFLQKSIRLGDGGLTGNFAMRHMLTSFGYDISAQVFLIYAPFNMAFAYHSYMNYKNYFPAVEAELVDYPLSFGKFGLFLSPRLMVGTQPKDQVFKTGSHEFFSLFGLRIDFMASKHFLPYLDFTAKTDGWVAGNEYLDSNVSIKIGVSARF